MGLLREQEASGQSLRSFARERGLSAWTLYGWRQRLGRARPRRRSAAHAGAPGLVAVDVVGEPAREIEVVLADGVRVRVPYSTSLERLVTMVQALRSC